MRRYLKVLLSSSLLAVSLPAWGAKGEAAAPQEDDQQDNKQQDNEQQGEAEAKPGETEATDVAPAETPKTPVVPGAKETLPGKVHTVVRGDTLWDLSQSYLGTPWYWPKVWSYNPQIANPHWIYPGNQVRFFPAGDEGPSRVEVGEEPEQEEEEPVNPADTFTVEEKPNDTVEVVGKIGYTPVKGSTLVRRQGFATPKELDEAGVLTDAPVEQLLLSPPDRVYFTFKRNQTAKVGDRYVLFHTVKDVYNKRNGKRAGYLTKLLGTARVLSVSEKRVVARLEQTWDEVRRGDRVGPFGEQYLDRIVLRPNDRTLQGHVVAGLDPSVTLYGEFHYVLVDLGSADGVQVGNTFTVVRQNDPSTFGGSVDPSEEVNRDLPLDNIATCMAVDVRERASTCLLMRSVREVLEGDRVTMTAGAVADSKPSH
jgi:LysM repeat protein